VGCSKLIAKEGVLSSETAQHLKEENQEAKVIALQRELEIIRKESIPNVSVKLDRIQPTSTKSARRIMIDIDYLRHYNTANT